jgi:hypothetical protein
VAGVTRWRVNLAPWLRDAAGAWKRAGESANAKFGGLRLDGEQEHGAQAQEDRKANEA